ASYPLSAPAPFALRRQLRHDAVKRADLLMRQACALEEVADVAHHARPLLAVAQEAAGVELLLQMGEEVEQLGLRRRPRLIGHELAGRGPVPRLEPFVA